MFSQLNLWLGVAAGVVVALALASAYNTLIDNPSIVKETRVKVWAEAQQITLKAMSEVGDEAERARAMRRYCRDTGRVFNFSTGTCG